MSADALGAIMVVSNLLLPIIIIIITACLAADSNHFHGH